VYKRDDFRVNVLQAWLGGSTWSSWFNSAPEIKKVVDEGYRPEIIHLYFDGEGLQHVDEHRDEYIADVKKLAALIKDSGVGDKTIVTLEPEYNQGIAASWDGWNDLMIEAINILHTETGAKVGLLPGPWDIGHEVPISMGRAAAYADFVALQEMKGSVTNTVDDAHSAISNAIQFTHFLNRRFLRPVRLGYLMISSYNGWEYVQRDVAIEACERLPELKAAGLTALSWMAYLDSPSDGALGAAESFKGLKTVDNEAKPAFYVWQECMKNGPSWLAKGVPIK
jgi:hypothetical protein